MNFLNKVYCCCAIRKRFTAEKKNGSATRCVTYPGKGYSAAIKHTTRDGTVYEEASGHITLSDA